MGFDGIYFREAAMNINPRDPVIAHQVKPVLRSRF